MIPGPIECFFFFSLCFFKGIGAVIGLTKGRPVDGAVLGFLIGPLGWIVMFLLLEDYRPKCPACLSTVPVGARRCPVCQENFAGPASAKVSQPLSRRHTWVVGTAAIAVVVGIPLLFLLAQPDMSIAAYFVVAFIALVIFVLPGGPWILDWTREYQKAKKPPPIDQLMR